MLIVMKLKQEPLSPSDSNASSLLSEEELTSFEWFEDTTSNTSLYLTSQNKLILEQDELKLEDDDYLIESCSNDSVLLDRNIDSKAEVASQILENLENLVDLDELIKEEPFFLDEKVLPNLGDVDVLPIPENKLVSIISQQNENTGLFLQDFNYCGTPSDFASIAAQNTLTPPQTPPPYNVTSILTTLEPAAIPNFVIPKAEAFASSPLIINAFNVPENKLFENVLGFRSTQQPQQPEEFPVVQEDIAHELELVDELVRSRVENMQWATSSGLGSAEDGSQSPPSPCSNSNTSGSCYDDSSSSEDPEWFPESSSEVDNNGIDKRSSLLSGGSGSRKRSKPYSRNSDDRKSRKKEQNKNAATRYRQKKKAEVEVILSEEKGLMQVGQNLGNQITDLEREIKYLKGLMRDLFKAKGLI